MQDLCLNYSAEIVYFENFTTFAAIRIKMCSKRLSNITD